MAIDPTVMAGNGHQTQVVVDEATLRREELKAAKAQRKAANAARYAAHAQEDAETFRLMAANAQMTTAAAQEAAANAQRDAAIAQRDYFVALRANMPAAPSPAPAPVPAAPQVVIQRDPLVAFVLGFLMLAILLLAAVIAQGMITGRLFGPTPPPPPPAVTLPVVPIKEVVNSDDLLKREVVEMFGGIVDERELSVTGKSVTYNFDSEIHSIHFPTNFPMFAVIGPGWEIKDMDARLTFAPGEKHYFPQHSGSFVATKVVN